MWSPYSEISCGVVHISFYSQGDMVAYLTEWRPSRFLVTLAVPFGIVQAAIGAGHRSARNVSRQMCLEGTEQSTDKGPFRTSPSARPFPNLFLILQGLVFKWNIFSLPISSVFTMGNASNFDSPAIGAASCFYLSVYGDERTLWICVLFLFSLCKRMKWGATSEGILFLLGKYLILLYQKRWESHV